MNTMLNTLSTRESSVSLDHLKSKELKVLGDNILNLLALSGVDTGRATYYNDREEAEKQRTALHKAVFSVDRSIYGHMLCLPGVTDLSKQLAVSAMLSNPWNGVTRSAFPIEHERKIIDYLVNGLQANRKHNLFVNLRNEKVNNSRTRSTILPVILGSNLLELWCVKYRKKINKALKHAWNERRASILKAILAKDRKDWKVKEDEIVTELIHPYVRKSSDRPKVYECVSFVLGNTEGKFTLPLLKAFQKAKTNFSAGKILPPEVLEGIRGMYHSKKTTGEVLKSTEKVMTSNKKRLVQKSAKRAGVKIAFDPKTQDLVKLYIYAFEMGMSDEIAGAMKAKAKKAALSLPFRFPHVGVLLDDSHSMKGSDTQKMRPMAIALAMKDVLSYTAEMYTALKCSDKKAIKRATLTTPVASTDLADGLLTLIEKEPQAIFVISDGYENRPAGRFAEVVSLLEQIGCPIPIYHINPVSAAESKKAQRQLAPSVPVMPVSNPEALGLPLFKSMLETDPVNGIKALISMTMPLIEGGAK